MAYLVGGLIGLGGLYWWIRGYWFPALVLAIVLATALVALPSPGMQPAWWMTLICLIGPWLPMLGWAAFRRVSGDIKFAFSPTATGSAAGTSRDQDAAYWLPLPPSSGAP